MTCGVHVWGSRGGGRAGIDVDRRVDDKVRQRQEVGGHRGTNQGGKMATRVAKGCV